MKRRKAYFFLGIGLIVAFLIIGFIIYSFRHFRIQENFSGIPLSFNPIDATSEYDWKSFHIKVQGGFVKGNVLDEKKRENLLVRSLSPTPLVTIKNTVDHENTCLLQMENINPQDAAIGNIDNSQKSEIGPHTVLLTVVLNAFEEKTIRVRPKSEGEYFEFVILGDNRNGYQTFSNIIQQINGINPVFAIDNGDLVFGGEPNKYRLLNQTIEPLRVPLYTTLGNHDIRENGRPLYTMLFGPPYYSFDYGNVHFVFLDSSRGWSEKRAIPDEEYAWLENDLKNTQGKRIYVISHIPPTDPRATKEPNMFPETPEVDNTTFFQWAMDRYSQFKNLDHGFPSPEEARRFESLMSKYHVSIVFLSHIHSYYSYIKDNVRYIISGGGGAELLSQNSFYHYMRVKVTDKDEFLEVVSLPSPPNTIQDRYLAALQLFALSVSKEYRTTLIVLAALLAVILGWILFKIHKKIWRGLKFLYLWLSAVLSFGIARYKEMKSK